MSVFDEPVPDLRLAVAIAEDEHSSVDSTSTPVCELVGITKTYASSAVVVGPVDLKVSEGEFFSLLGPSGCGKSTTLRMIAGLERSSSGAVWIRGKDETSRPPNVRPTNMVFQDLALFPHLDVADNIAFGLKLKRVSKKEISERVGQMLELVYLPGYQKRRVQELSGGQRQRVAIARALVQRPALVLLDEPLGALDLRLRLGMQEVLKNIQRSSQTSFVYVTHDQTEAFAMSDRIGVMNEGKLVQIGSPREIYEAPASSFVAKFVGDANLLAGSSSDGWFTTADASVRIPGEGNWLAVRPECVAIGDDAVSLAGVQVGATVIDMAFLGSNIRHTVRLVGGQTMHTLTARTAQQRVPLPGDETTIGWKLLDSSLLAE